VSSPPPTNAPPSHPSAAGESCAKPRSRFRCCIVPALAAAWFVSAVVFALVLRWPTDITRARWEQPNTVKYESHDPYVLYVKDISPWWQVSERDRYRVGVVAAVQGDFLYGHWTEYGFHNYWDEPDYFTRCTVTWTAEGVTVTEPTGHHLFIPKNAFVGGR
jgi:hypothetical protein